MKTIYFIPDASGVCVYEHARDGEIVNCGAPASYAQVIGKYNYTVKKHDKIEMRLCDKHIKFISNKKILEG